MNQKILINILLGLLSGIFVALSTPIIYGLDWLVFIALIPILVVFNQKNLKHSFFATLAYSLSTNFLLFFWIPNSLTEMWKFPFWTTWLVFIPFALFSEIHIFLLALIRNKILKNTGISVSKVLLISVCYCGIEYSFETLFPDNLGGSLYPFKYLRQVLDISSMSIASFIIWSINECLLMSYQKKLRLKSLILTTLIIGLSSSYGWLRYHSISQTINSSPKINALVIQPNFHHNERNSARLGEVNVVEKVLSRHYEMTLAGLKQYPESEFIVWPETTYPFYFQSYSSIYQQQKEVEITNFLHNQNKSLFFGSFGKTGEPAIVKNNVYVIDHKTEPANILRFEKTVLFPFGEYIPGIKYFPFLGKLFPKANTPTAAPEPIVQPIGDKQVNIGAAICYEVLFNDLFFKLSQKNTSLVVNVTNESYFGNFGEPQLNMLHTALRATEVRLPIMRSANTGISGFINQLGTITKSSKMDEQIVLADSLSITKLHEIDGLYSRFGNWFGKLGLLIYIITFIILFRPRNNE